jgi:uncharacterized protein (TIGR03435 family)
MKHMLLVALMSGVAFAQTGSPAFESAAVHVSARSNNPTMRGGALRGERYELRTATMVDLISVAYSMESDKVLGGPNWLDWDRFDLAAKVAPGTKQEDLRRMLQNLLADRFKLVVHKDTRPMPAFALSVGAGKPKMKEGAGGTEGCGPVPQNPAPAGTVPYQAISCRNLTMAGLAGLLFDLGGGSYLPDPVVDQTGLSGTWDFELKWTARNRLAQAGSDGISLFDAVDKQLGLKLEAKKIPLPVLMIDSVNQAPTPNAPGVNAQIPPAPPTEFEVATVKPSAPDAAGQAGQIQNGRVDVSNFTLRQLIMLAWDLGNNEDFVIGLPNSAGSARYDISAKVSTSGPVDDREFDFDTIRIMLQRLLIERFGIKAHMEDRPVSAYTMTATKQLKLQKAEPENRTNCKSGAGTSPMLNRMITCQNTNMAQLAVALQNMANGYVRAPIKDATGIEGYFDFSVSFSGVNLLPGRVFDPNAATGATDPNGSLPLPDALQKQLGLKLDLEKRPLPVLVVDQVQDKPADN